MKERVATHVIEKTAYPELNLCEVGDVLYRGFFDDPEIFTSERMEKFFGNDHGMHISGIGEVVTIEIWNSPLYKALR